MANGVQIDGMESQNGVLPIDGLCSPQGGLLEANASAPISRQRQPMASAAGGHILCDQLDGTICRAKGTACADGDRRLTAL